MDYGRLGGRSKRCKRGPRGISDFRAALSHSLHSSFAIEIYGRRLERGREAVTIPPLIQRTEGFSRQQDATLGRLCDFEKCAENCPEYGTHVYNQSNLEID